MFVVFQLTQQLNIGDIIFVVDDLLFNKSNKYELMNYLCGWKEITQLQSVNDPLQYPQIEDRQYIAIYIDYTINTYNVNYKFKYYNSNENTIYDLNTNESISNYSVFGYGTFAIPIIFSLGDKSVLYETINEQSVQTLLNIYL